MYPPIRALMHVSGFNEEFILKFINFELAAELLSRVSTS